MIHTASGRAYLAALPEAPKTSNIMNHLLDVLNSGNRQYFRTSFYIFLL